MSKPRVILDEEVYRKIMFWVNESPDEISGLGTVIYDKEADAFRVKSTMLLPQENHATETEISAEGITKAMYVLRDAPGELRFWWHSHVNMSVFWSGTDRAAMKQIGGHGWVISSVFNKKKESKTAFYSEDYVFPLFLDDLELKVDELLDAREQDWRREYEENVKKKVFHRPQTFPVRSWGTGTNGNTATTAINSPQAMEIAMARGERPPGMSKREWKRAKRLHRERQDMRSLVLPDDDAPIPYIYPYPFSQEELSWLAAKGIDQGEIDEMITAGWDRGEILREVQEAIDSQIRDDIPVADRRWH